MSEIPEDILRAAKRAYMTYPKAGEDEWMPIARAFLEQREKFASIADRYAQNNKGGRNPQAFAAYTVATEIAQDIRTAPKPSSAVIAPADYEQKLADYLEALDEWGCEDSRDRAQHILEFQRTGYDLDAYLVEHPDRAKCGFTQ